MPDQFTQLQEIVIAGDGEAAKRLTAELLAAGTGAREILDGALLPAMDVVGARMRSGECFIPEVLLSARTMQGALDLLKPHLSEGEQAGLGTVVIGTVEGDLHDIGKNLVAMMLEGAGFSGHQPRHQRAARRKFVAGRQGAQGRHPRHERPADHHPAAHARDPGSPSSEAGLRDSVKVMAGGAPVTASFCEELGADGYGANAALAVEKAKELDRQGVRLPRPP